MEPDKTPDVLGPPGEAVTLERTYSLVNEAMHTVALQRRRLKTTEPEDSDFAMRPWADWEFFIISLWRLRRRANAAKGTALGQRWIRPALHAFDEALPDLKLFRDVAEHIDEYAIDSSKRHEEDVWRTRLQVGTWDDTTLVWPLRDKKHGRPKPLNADEAMAAAVALLTAVRRAHDEAQSSLD
jgi:hypothetical protein